ncbi:DUF383-domain-containing protein [Calocera viscosa TUFC12733]|uniref:Protein HGH1 homolog n=1 Tax=Calocera viscosa (strain TUFC12733) TaxID=1330018 RepID=A0A167S8M0_CALVF|nr:DUF383-domain-containing protein [Calocera viscosa TUFC12733]
MSMEAQLEELLQFLHDRNPQARQVALANLVGYTPKESPYRSLFVPRSAGGLLPNKGSKQAAVIRDLKLLCQDQPATAHDAFRALVNISDNAMVLNHLIDVQFLTFLVSYILNPTAVLADLASMLLSNITVNPTACSTLVTMKIPVVPLPKETLPFYPTASRSATSSAPPTYRYTEESHIAALPLLVDAFIDGARVQVEGHSSEKRKGELHFLSSVFANISAIPAGRTLFLTPVAPDPVIYGEGEAEYMVAKLLAFTEHKDLIRRGGVLSTIKNCAFYAPAHRALLSPETAKVKCPPSEIAAPGINILPFLLLPLAGPEEFDLDDQELLHPTLQFLPPTKSRETDPVLRLTIVETLLLLCTTYWGREELRRNGTYQIIRMMHETEEDDNVIEHIDRLVNLLKRDETEDTKRDDEMVASELAEEGLMPEDEDTIMEV